MRVFHFLNAKYALQSLRTGRLKVARIDELDDPFELIGADLRDPKVRRGFQKNKEHCAARFGYLSFTRRWQNLMLWSKYADRHQGAVLEIELPDEAAIPVRYQKHRLKLDVAKIMALGGVHSGARGCYYSDEIETLGVPRGSACRRLICW